MGPHLPQMYEVWRRPQGSDWAWEKVPGLQPMERHEAFRAALAQQWVAGLTDYECIVVEVGQLPQAGRRSRDGYQTKRMRPR